MANKSYLNLEDELNDRSPYSSLSDRETLEPLGLEGLSEIDDGDGDLDAIEPNLISPQSAVKAAISAKMKPMDTSNDPLMKGYQEDQSSLQGLREAKQGADFIGNLGQAFSQLAQGANAPKPNQGLFENMASQNNSMMKSSEGDLDRKRKVIQAIENRKLRQTLTNAATQSKNDRLSGMNVSRASSLMSNPNVSKETTKLNAARSVQSLIDGIRSGEIKDSKNIRNQLTNMITTIELGSPGGVNDRHEMGIDNLYTALKDMESKLTSSPQSTIPPEFLSQLESEGHALGDRAAKNYSSMANSILSGADLSGGNPDIDPGQIHQLIKQRKENFLKQNGYDPQTGSRIGQSRSQSKLTPQTEKSGLQTKVIGGVTYAKVPGGWQEVEE